MEYTDRASKKRDTIRFAYNENGNMISGEVLDYNGDVETAISMHYDGNGVLREVQKSTIFFQSKTKTSYDENGRMVETYTQLGEDVYRSYHCSCDYNEQGKLTCSTVNRHWETGTETTSTTRYEYNDRGMLIAMGCEGEEDSFYSLGKWSDSNRTVEFTYVLDNGATITNEYEYDEAGNCIRNTCYRNGKLESQITYTFIALQLPSNYKAPSEDEPRFLQF